ncbi:MAG TPA: hypothetical protein VIK03_07610 [Thermoleophilia bacterium]
MTDLEKLLQEHGAAPEHAPGFESLLWAAIHAEDAGGAAAEAGPEPVREVAGPTRRRSRRRAALAVAVLAAVLVVVVVSGRHTVRELQQPPVASAATVITKVRQALVRFKTISATIVSASTGVSGPDTFEPGWTSADWFAHAHVDGRAMPIGDPERILATADGRLRKVTPVTAATWSVGPGPDGTTAVVREAPQLELTRDVPALMIQTYDDAAGIMGLYAPGYHYGNESGSGMAAEQALLTTRTPLGPPDSQGEVASWMGTEGFSLSALSVLARGTVVAAIYDGRPALVVGAEVTPGPAVPEPNGQGMMFYGQFDRIEITVDEATWFPVRFTTRLHGDVVGDQRLTDIRFDVPVTDAQFTPSFPKGAVVEVDNEHFRRVGFGEAARAFDYRPLAPSVPPRGFHRFAAAVAPHSRFFVMEGPGDSSHEYWLPSRDITALGYRAGFLAFTVTTRSEVGMHDPRLADPFAGDPSLVTTPDQRETVTLERGALRGVAAQLATPTLGVPHLWTFHDGLMITVAGDLTRDQLLLVANSLEPLR